MYMSGPECICVKAAEDTHCFYTCGYGYYQRASVVKVFFWQGPSSAPVRPSSGLALGSPAWWLWAACTDSRGGRPLRGGRREASKPCRAPSHCLHGCSS